VITFKAFGIRFSLPLLTIAAPLLAARLGMQGVFRVLVPALGLHELAHIFAAKLAKVELQEIRLMPFGGSARMENPYRLPACKLIPVAVAGPLANLMLAVLFAAAAHWGWLLPEAASAHIRANLLLCVFNLIPALPLDGGRILFALLRIPCRERLALELCIWTGRALALFLFVIAVCGMLKTGMCNLSCILAAVFILASAHDERSALAKSYAQRMAALLDTKETLPVRLLQADKDTSVQDALQLLQPHSRTWFILSRSGTPFSLLYDQNLLEHLMENGAPEAALGTLQTWQLPGQRTFGAKYSL